jgi:checkpoint serine/threonine-protein kinase
LCHSTEVLPLLERCTRELQEVPRYKDDARYLRIWVKYADCCKEPHDIFKFLQANDIGQRHTLFYEAYAAFLEIRGAFTQANEVYDRGIMMRAAPRDRLKDKLAQFQHRMMKRKQRKLDEGGGAIEEEGAEGEPASSRRFGDRGGAGGSGRAGGGADAENPGGGGRGGMAAVRRGGGGAAGTSGAAPAASGSMKRSRGYRGAGTGAASSDENDANANDGGLEIYCDEDDAGGGAVAPAAVAPAPWHNLGKYQETRKENTQAASTWAGQTLKQKRSRPSSAGAPPPAETLEVYEDEDLAQEQAEAEAKAVAVANAAAAKTNANALRRRLDAADAGAALSSGLGGGGGGESDLSSNPMLYHGRGAPAPKTCVGEPAARPATLYGRYDAGDMTDGGGEEVCYEQRRAARWEAANGPAPTPAPTPGPIVGGEAQAAAQAVNAEEDMEMDMDMDECTMALPAGVGGVFATSTATTAPVLATVPEAADEMLSPEPQSAPPPPLDPSLSLASCEAPPADEGSGVAARVLDPTDEAQGVPAAPLQAAPAASPAPAPAPPAAAAAVPAGLRWTATEGGTYGVQDPTMTICTKEAWGDIMSMFSGGLASEGEAEEKRARKAAADGAGTAGAAAGAGPADPALSPVAETTTPAAAAAGAEAEAAEEEEEEGGFAIYEDTCLLPANAAAAAVAAAAAGDTAPLPSPAADGGFGLDIREDTVVLPPAAMMRTPAPAAAAGLAARTPLGAMMPARTPLAPTTAPGPGFAPTPASARLPLASRQAASMAMPPPAPVAMAMTPGAAPADENDAPADEIQNSWRAAAAAADVNVTAGEDSFAIYEDTTADIPGSAAASVAVSLDQPGAPASTPAPSDDGGFEIYQDTMLLDPAAVAAAAAADAPAPVSPAGADHAAMLALSQGEGSHGSAPAGSAQPARTLGEPSETSPEEQEQEHAPAPGFEVYADDAENAAPADHVLPALDQFVPRSIADAAAAAAALRPLAAARMAALDVRMMPEDEETSSVEEGERSRDTRSGAAAGASPAPGTLAYAEQALRTAKPPPELQGEDDFEVYANEEVDTAPLPREGAAVGFGGSGGGSRLSPIMSEPEEGATPASVSPPRAGTAAPAPTPMAATPTGRFTPGAATPAAAAAAAADPDDVTAPVPASFTIDPFDPAVMDAHLAAVEPPLASWQGVHVHAGEEPLVHLRAASKAGGGARQRARGGTKLTLGGSEYVLMGSAGSGAHAEVYEGEYAEVAAAEEDDDDDDFGDEDDHDKHGGLAIKVQSERLAKWEWVISKRLAERLSDADAAGVVQPTALHLVGGAEGSAAGGSDDARAGVIVMPFGEHGTLQDVVNSYLRVGKSMDELLVIYYAIELLRLTESMHGAGVLHADLKPDNLLLRNGGADWCDWAAHRPGSWKEKGLALIDLGRAIDLTAFPAGAAFVGDCHTEGFRCSEMIEGKPWTYQADMHCVAATVHTLLFGRYMQVEKVAAGSGGGGGEGGGSRFRTREPLRRYWKTELWEAFFETLLNGGPAGADADAATPPPLGDLRRMFEQHVTSEGLGQKLRLGLMKQTINMYQQIREGKA